MSDVLGSTPYYGIVVEHPDGTLGLASLDLHRAGTYWRAHEGRVGPWSRALLYRWEPARKEGAST